MDWLFLMFGNTIFNFINYTQIESMVEWIGMVLMKS